MVKREKKDYLIQSLSNALAILELFSIEHEEYGMGEIASLLGLKKRNAERLLNTLERREYLERNRVTGNYRLGFRVFELGQRHKEQLSLMKQASPVVRELSQDSGETSYAGDLRGEYVVYLVAEESTKHIRVVSRLGMRFFPHTTALGKAILAFSPEDVVDEVFTQDTLPQKTSNSISSKSALKEELAAVREKGFALDMEEEEEGVRCVGVPVFDYTLRVVGGISVSGPATRLSKERIEAELAPLVVKGGEDVSRRLGYRIGQKIQTAIGGRERADNPEVP